MWAGAILIAVAGADLTILAWSDFEANDAISNMGGSASSVVYASLGALIVRRVRNPIGWLLLIAGAGIGMDACLSSYAMVGIVAHPGALPVAEQVGAVAEWVFFRSWPCSPARSCSFRPGHCRRGAGARSRCLTSWRPGC